MLELYENIKAYRKRLNMTQTELALKTGYTDKSAIAKIEAGKVDLSQSKILAFAKALNTTPSELMGKVEFEDELEYVQLSLDETALLNAYRKAPKDIQNAVKVILGNYDK